MSYRPFCGLLAWFVLLHLICFGLNALEFKNKYHLAVPVQVWVDDRLVGSSAACLAEIRVDLPRSEVEQLGKLRVAIGDREFAFDREDVRSRWRTELLDGDRLALVAPPEVTLPRSRLPFIAAGANWRGDRVVVDEYLPWVWTSGFFLLAAWLLLRWSQNQPRLAEAIRRGLGIEPLPVSDAPAATWLWAAGGLVAVLLGFARLESLEPYYFTQDDNLVGIQPMVLYSCQAIFAGYRPEWNPFQFCGAPVLSLGIFSLTYPPTLLSYAGAHYLLGDDNAILEVFALLHLLAGYGLNYAVARRVGMAAPLAMAGALSVVFSGCSLIMGRSWFNVGLPWLVWLPALMLCLLRLQRGDVGWRWAAVVGLMMGCWYQVGFTPLWLYGMAFFGLVVGLLWWAAAVPTRRLPWVVVAGLHALALSVPPLIVMLDVAGPIQMGGNYGNGIAQGTLAMLLPYPLVEARHPNEWGTFHYELMGHFYYWGTVFPAALLLVVMLFVAARGQRPPLAANVWLVAASVAGLLTLGHAGILWQLVSITPVFGPVNNHPFRVLPELLFFGMLAGGLFLQRFASAWPQGPRRLQGVALATIVLIAWHVNLCRPSFRSFAERPTPPLPHAFRTVLEGAAPTADGALPPARVLSALPQSSAANGYMKGLMHCLPTRYRLPALDGSDPIVDNTMPFTDVKKWVEDQPLATTEALGVRWLLGDDLREPTWPDGCYNHLHAGTLPRPSDAKYSPACIKRLQSVARQRLELDGLTVSELPAPDALAFAAPRPKEALPLHWRPDRLVVDTSSLAANEELVVNFLWRKQWFAWGDEQPLEVREDPFHRMVVRVPSGTAQVTLRFAPPWRKALLLGLLIELVALIASMVLARWSQGLTPATPCEPTRGVAI